YLGITSLLSNKEKLKDKYEEVLNAVSHVNLPEDLSLIRDMLKISLNRVKGRLKFSDFISFGNKYAELWLSERKKENLEKVINKIYGAGGRADLEIY
ncbi:MAG: beta-N-acetylhexosaminidase, partial [Dictyoglomus turgidum]